MHMFRSFSHEGFRPNPIAAIEHGFILSLVLLFGAIAARAHPILEAQPRHVDFGEAVEGTHVPVQFKIVNTGDSVARVEKTTQSSGCIAPGPPLQKKISPGEEVKLDYRFDTTGYGGVTAKKWIKIEYNNPEISPLQIIVSGHVDRLRDHQAAPGEMMYNFFALLDIRNEREYEQSHILGAINIPPDNMEKWKEQVSEEARAKSIFYIYSEHGEKSDEVAKMLRRKGFRNAFSLVGGLQEFRRQYGESHLINCGD